MKAHVVCNDVNQQGSLLWNGMPDAAQWIASVYCGARAHVQLGDHRLPRLILARLQPARKRR